MHKIMDLKVNGRHYVCKHDASKNFPYRLYLEWSEPKMYGMKHCSRTIAQHDNIGMILLEIISREQN